MSIEKLSTRDNLIDIGLKLVRSAGYNATGINEILHAAGVPKGSFYHHFSTKDQFVIEVIRRYIAGEQRRMETLLFAASSTPLQRLRRYFKDLIATYGQRGGPIAGCLLGNLSLEIAGQNGKIRDLINQGFQGWQDAIATAIRHAIKAGELPRTTNAGQVAALLVNGWEGAQVRAKADQNDKALQLFYRHAFQNLLKS